MPLAYSRSATHRFSQTLAALNCLSCLPTSNKPGAEHLNLDFDDRQSGGVQEEVLLGGLVLEPARVLAGRGLEHVHQAARLEDAAQRYLQQQHVDWQKQPQQSGHLV